MHLTKHEGLSNDFLIAYVPDLSGEGEAVELARRWCHRRKGIGADGLIFALPGSSGGETFAEGADLRMRLFNSDGSEAEISGNGVRCLAHAECRRRGDAHCDLTIASPSGNRAVTVDRVHDSRTAYVTVDMGVAKPGPAVPSAVQALASGPLGTVDLGNPHLVVRVEDPDAVAVAKEGPELASHFPGGINVHFVSVDEAGDVDMRIWERGAGMTESCGSGACAAAVISRSWQEQGPAVKVRMPGGEAEVRLGETITLAGDVQWVADIEVPS